MLLLVGVGNGPMMSLASTAQPAIYSRLTHPPPGQTGEAELPRPSEAGEAELPRRRVGPGLWSRLGSGL